MSKPNGLDNGWLGGGIDLDSGGEILVILNSFDFSKLHSLGPKHTNLWPKKLHSFGRSTVRKGYLEPKFPLSLTVALRKYRL